MSTATVPVKSAWSSKINWVAAASALIALAAAFGLEMTEELRTAVLTAIPVIGGVVVWILRTFFTKSLTKGSTKEAT